MESLIYDRTLSDITNLTSKGQYNASDLNRVESWTKYLNDKFNELGYRTERKLDYIESTGTQWIDTGFKHNQNTRIVLEFQMDVYKSWANIIGSYGGARGANKLFFLGNDNMGKHYAHYDGGERYIDVPAEGRHILDFNKNVLTLDGKSFTFTKQTFQSEYNCIIFGVTTYNGSISKSSYKLCSCKIYDNDNLVRDYIPDIDSDGIVCLYDKVTQTYFYNKGTGEFIAGYGDGYKDKPITVDYIESTGTQYIDTGIAPKLGYKVEIGFQATSVPAGESWIYGIWETSGFRCGMAGGTYDATRGFTYSQTDNKTEYIVAEGNNTIKDYTGNAYLFAQQENGNAGYMSNSKYKLYYCKIWDDNNILIRDYIPTIDLNKIACLYDKVSGAYFYNKGTGNFKVGYKELVNPVYEVKDFTDTSLFNDIQHSTRTLINEETPISNSFIRLSKTVWEYPASGFTLANREQLQFEGNVVACVVYKFTTDNGNPRMGWSSSTGGGNVWNCTSANWNACEMPRGEGWLIHRVKASKTQYENFKNGSFGFCQQWRADNIVLDIAGISFYNLTDEQYADTDYINSLGVAGFGASAKPWEYQDDFVLAEADRIINNINVLRSIIALYNDTPKTPETMRFLDYIKANNIEKILFDIDKLVNNMVANFRYSNDLISGEGYYS